ncbi:putative indolepyruvate oxidoreductase subunit B (plasmid) [Sulfitobacter sp. THAF37]|uniref:indolepyruvate oxidoreductase subunit beta family protein n=1 Tax=Sulfitobacter sp. THAF37 TaxID=2587855 RepID=UPI00126810A1|nr:indolepyruvate oxidoreductase subunit beta family protein [Sulfitobacter sp. THAF37]QFT61180.1 putative indolepyruvate oxidoreductase subunit B [Sulfitobacter sp. THAF37]
MKDDTVKLGLKPAGPATERPISIAIVAMGGQGGGVLTGWIVDLAETHGWVAQSTSVPGVAQRTGATIYYVEMMRPGDGGQKPVLAQMPTPGDVDVVIASEFMEAGRSILRGIVTPDRTTLIASSHRSLAISEKTAPGGSIADSGAVTDAIGVVARQEIVFDMNTLAVRNGSVISSAMFGSLAASGTLPFEREAYHDVIRKGGKGVEASIRAFDAAFDRTINGADPETADAGGTAATVAALPQSLRDKRADALLSRLRADLPEQAHEMAYLGLQKVVDFQDAAYGDEYLDLLRDLYRRDRDANGAEHGFAFTTTAAKYLANAMAYDDVIRVARIKTQSARRQRVADEVGLQDGQVLNTTEFMHPRMEEAASVLPVGLANWLKSRKSLYAWLDRRIDRGRRIQTYRLIGFLPLHFVGALRGMRRKSLRHKTETEHRDAWLADASQALTHNYDLGVAMLGFRRLIKGYSDTHVRGHSKFEKVMQTTKSIAGRDDAAEWANRLLTSAIRDASSKELDGTIMTIESFSKT